MKATLLSSASAENVVDDVPHVNISNMPNAGMETKILVIDDYIAPPEWWGCRIVVLNLQDQPLTVGDTTLLTRYGSYSRMLRGERCYKHKESPCWCWDGENYILASATVTINFDNSDTQSLPPRLAPHTLQGTFPCCAQTSVENIIT